MTSEVSIAFLGDIFLGERSGVTVSQELIRSFSRADLVIGNLEGPLVASGSPIGGKGCLKQAETVAAVLKSWGVHVVSLANNHVFDYGWAGFENTRRLLGEAGISFFGAGENLAIAGGPLVIDIRGLRVGVLGFASVDIETRCATEGGFGCSPLEGARACSAVRGLAQDADVVIVVVHWGRCEYACPTPEQLNLATELLAAGATAIVGHHSHTVQGLVARSGSVVAYSLGNFAFAEYEYGGKTARFSEENRQGLVLLLSAGGEGVRAHEVRLTRFDGRAVELDESAVRKRVFERLSAEVAAADYARLWRAYVRRRLGQRLWHWLHPGNWNRLDRHHFVAVWLMLTGMWKRRT